MAYPNAVFSTFSFIGFILSLIPLYWHIEAWNVGTTLYMAWAGLGCLNVFINSIVWNSTVENLAPVWCDISSRFIVGLAVGIPASLLVINRRLYKIASRTAAISTKAERRRAVYVDLAIGLSIPFVQMALQLVVEGHRFDIYEEIGCYPDTFNVTLAYPIEFIWPTVLSIITLVYSSLNIRIFWKSSRLFNGLLSSGSSRNPNQSRYNRLIALSAAQIFATLPITIFSIYFNAHDLTVFPWISWEDTHAHYSFVGQIPSFVWRSSSVGQFMGEITRWYPVISAFLFFGFFGFAEEALKKYRMAYSFASRSLGLPEFGKSKTNSSPQHTPFSSFGQVFKKRAATLLPFNDGFSTLGSRGESETITERKASSLVAEYRLTSSASIFGGVDNSAKALEAWSDDDDSEHSLNVLPVVSGLPVTPPPIAYASIRLPSHRLNSPLPHRPTSSNLNLDPSEKV